MVGDREENMGAYSWERAEIVLPSKDVAAVKAAMTEFSNRLHAAVYELSRELHKQVKTRASAKYAAEVNQLCEALSAKLNYAILNHRTPPPDAPFRRAVIELARFSLTGHWWGSSGTTPTLPTHEATDRFAPRATSRTRTWVILGAYGEKVASVHLVGRTLTWDVEEDKNAVSAAHSAPGATVFFAALAKVNWTRATGGEGVGNDEDNQDLRHKGGGANYTTFRYGPLGGRPQGD